MRSYGAKLFQTSRNFMGVSSFSDSTIWGKLSIEKRFKVQQLKTVHTGHRFPCHFRNPRVKTFQTSTHFMGLSSFWEFLRFSRNFNRKSFQRAITQKLPYRKMFSLSFSDSSRQDLSNKLPVYGFISIFGFFTI